MTDWRTPETAPKDGTRILAYGILAFDTEPSIGTVRWCSVYSKWECDPNEATEYDTEACDVMAWMPLPVAPVLEALENAA